MTLQTCPAARSERPLLAGLLGDCLQELAGHRGPPAFLDAYWHEAGRRPWLIRQDGAVAGFALVNRHSVLGEPVEAAMAEFYILPAARRAGIGLSAAQHLIRACPGRWEVAVAPGSAAAAFWERVLRVPWIAAHRRVTQDARPVHRFHVPEAVP